MSERVEALREKLFGEEGASTFAILDGASVPGLLQKFVDHEPPHECIYPGDLKPDMQEVTPYLVSLDRDSQFTEWVLDRGWGQHWGVFVESGSDLATLRRQFRSLLNVHDSSGKPMLFRYYDPRVLRVYLPTCNTEELKTLFSLVQSYIMEDESGAGMLRFRMKNGALSKQAERIVR